MYFNRSYDEGLAQASYMVGCQEEGTAVVVDPRRDLRVYLELAVREGLRIVAVTETHIHADYLSGARELAEQTGAALYLSDEGGEDWQYGFPHQGLCNGSEIKLGKVTLRALHTPGHTPEHLSFLVSDGARTDEPVMLLSGDFVFVGDLGRPDLLDEAAEATDTRFAGAQQLFGSLRDVFLTLPEHVQVWPGHGSGSACGKALGAVPSTTVGYERLFAWWSPFLGGGSVAGLGDGSANISENGSAEGDSKGFSRELLSGQPDVPSYFARMKRQNRDGPAPVPTRELAELEPGDLEGTLLLDTRSREAYQQGSLANAISLSAGKNFETWAGWLLDPERETRPLVLLAQDGAEAQGLRERLWRVGIDDVAGYVTSLEALPLQENLPLSPRKFDALEDKFVLDVRTKAEYADGHIPGATLIHAGRLPEQLDDLPRDVPIVVHCQSGMRSVGAASLLRVHGFEDVRELAGGYPGWLRGQAVETSV